MAERELLKQLACQRAVQEVRSGMVLGLGTGSTVYYFLQELGRLVQGGLEILGIPTSVRTAQLATQLAIPLTTLEDHPCLDLAVDGADEVDARLNMVKGAGGALLREKIIAASAQRFLIVVDDSKIVTTLGERYPIPVEVVTFGLTPATRAITALGAQATLRCQDDGQPWVTDNGNVILDCHFDSTADPHTLQQHLLQIPAVVDTGLFIEMAHCVIIGQPDGVRVLER